MSQKASRKSATTEDKDKDNRQTDSPVKEMKKKIAANAEKEKQAAEKSTDKTEKGFPGFATGSEKADKRPEKSDKPADKTEKKPEKNGVNKDKKVENKQAESKQTETKDGDKSNVAEKDERKGEKNVKDDKDTKTPPSTAASSKPKQNGSKAHNGVSDVTLAGGANGTPHAPDAHATVSDDEDDVALVIDYEDELFPELTYEDSDECFEPPTPESAPSRSFTRRSQAKLTRTPETPRPASDKQPDSSAAAGSNADDSKETKILKLKDDATSTDRKLRSADSPRDAKKAETSESPKKGKEGEADVEGEKRNSLEVEVVVEVEPEEESRKTDTNYSKSRVKVSPYRRSGRLAAADQTHSSVMANYTGNNTTMEMDLTESSSFASEDPSLDDSSYLSGLRNIRGRRSYKHLKEMSLRQVAASRSHRTATAANSSATDSTVRPTAPVVGRKRKPELDGGVELAAEAGESGYSKRVRLFERIAQPFRRTLASTPLPARRNAEIVGINTDLPLTAPVASADTFDPESLKPTSDLPAPPLAPVAGPVVASEADREAKRCVVM